MSLSDLLLLLLLLLLLQVIVDKHKHIRTVVNKEMTDSITQPQCVHVRFNIVVVVVVDVVVGGGH